MSAPLVSVGIPVYNGERYISESIESMLQQEFTDFELVISDNASTDRTEEICRSYAHRDSRIKYFRSPSNIGAAPNYNRVFELASGQFFKWLAYDDRCLPGFLKRCHETISGAPSSVSLVYTLCDLIDGAGAVYDRAPDQLDTRASRPHQRLAYILRNVGYAHPLWGLVRTSAMRKTRLMAGGALADHILISELALTGEIWEIPEVHFQLRMHINNAWAICSQEQGAEAWKENKKATKKSRQALAAWHDPRKAGKKIWLPLREEVYWEQLKGVHHAQLNLLDKWLCYATVPTVCYWRRFKDFGGLWKRKLLGRPLQTPTSIPHNQLSP
jgi:glycosyltransferase involved in cell wall biosynthesis